MNKLGILLGWGVCTLLLCGLLLWFRRGYEGRSCGYQCYTWIMAGLTFLILLLAVDQLGRPIAGRILPPENLIGGLVLVFMLFLYPIEIINSRWFTYKQRLKLFLPGTVLVMVLLLMRPYCRKLHSLEDIWLYIDEFNVWFRVAALFLSLMPYLCFMLYHWRKNGFSIREIICYAFFIQLIVIFFILFMLTGSPVFCAFQLVAAICVVAWMTYQELFFNFGVPQEEVHSISWLQDSETEQKEIDLLIEKLYRLMDEEEIWRNPDINLPEMAAKLDTTRSCLSKAIQEAGFKNYSDLINRRRIMEFLELADSGQITSIQNAFFQIGFQSYEMGLRYFRKYTGLFPTDYLRYLRNGTSLQT